MTTITVELPDDLAERVSQAGLLNSPAIVRLIAQGMEFLDVEPGDFEREVRESLAQADSADARWLTHEAVSAEWAAERSALLSGQDL